MSAPKKRYKPNRYLRMVKDEDAYEASKIQAMIRTMDYHSVEGDFTRISIKDYLELLKRHTEVMRKLKKKGFKRYERDNDPKEVGEKAQSDEEKGVRKDQPAGVDSGVPTEDPFA